MFLELKREKKHFKIYLLVRRGWPQYTSLKFNWYSSSDSKECACSGGDPGSIPGLSIFMGLQNLEYVYASTVSLVIFQWVNSHL